jgi:excisionase family DNA binding protein
VGNQEALVLSDAVAVQPGNRAERRHPGSLLDFNGAAEFLAVTPRHVRRLWQERRIAGVKVGRAVRFTEADLLAYVERQRVEAAR